MILEILCPYKDQINLQVIYYELWLYKQNFVIISTILILVGSLVLMPITVHAHQSGCHRWHSCPSDTGSYVCGDLGYTSQCPNYYSAPKKTEPSQLTSIPKIPSVPLTLTKTVSGTDYKLTYQITSGSVTEIIPNENANSLIIEIIPTASGELTITLPREVIDAKIGSEDDDFFVLVDAKEVSFKEKFSGNERTLTIDYSANTDEIEIIGTFVIPEFGSLVILILVISIMSIILVSTKTGLFPKF